MASKKADTQSQDPSSDALAFQAMFESHPAALLLLEALTGVIVDANPAAQQLFGLPRAGLCGREINALDATAKPQVFDPAQTSFACAYRPGSGEEVLAQVQTSRLRLHGEELLFAIVQDVSARKRAEERQAVERNLLTTLLDILPDRIYVKDMLGRKIISNAADWQASGGKTPQDVLGKSDFDTYGPELAAKFWADDQKVLASGRPVINHEEPGRSRDGKPSWVLTTKMPLRDENGKVTGLVGIGRDITERKQVEDALQESKLLFHLLIESLPQNIYAKDLEGRFIFANQHYCAMQGKTLEEIVGRTDFELHQQELAEKYRADDQQVMDTGKTLEVEEEHAPINGKRIFVQVIKTPFFDSKGQTAGTLGIFWDITDRKRADLELRAARDELELAHHELQHSYAREHRLAHLDELTGINNRRSLVEYAEREFSIAERYGSSLALMMFDIDDFKLINDTFGHPVGDLVLENLTQNVCAQLRVTDIIGRYGGDEFVVLLPQTNAHEAQALAGRIQAHLAEAALVTGQGALRITLSIGIAQTPHGGKPDSLKKLFLRVDQALYAAKQAGKNCWRGV